MARDEPRGTSAPLASAVVQDTPRSDAPTFDTFVMVDWSAASSPGREGGQTGGIWAAVAQPGHPDEVRPFRTRSEATTWLIATCAQLADRGRRVLLGFDFAFGYPTGTARALGAPPRATPWRWMWDLLALEIADDASNDNDRFGAASGLNERMQGGAGPFWGHPPNQLHADLAPTKGTFPLRIHDRIVLEEYRHTERVLREGGRQPKSVWQLSGAGAVGSQSLLGIPRLRQVRRAPALAPRTAVWPLETGFGDPLEGADARQVVIAEVYPSLIEPTEGTHPVRDAAQVLALVAAYRAMAEAGTLAEAFAAPDQPADVLEQVVAEEGWILDVVAAPPPPPRERHPSAAPFDWEAEDVVAGAPGASPDDAPEPSPPHPGPTTHVRIARPSHDLAAAERFYTDGLGMDVLFRTPAPDDESSDDPPADGVHRLVMVGWPGAAWHIELVGDPATDPRPTEEDLLVCYLDGPVDPELIERLVDAGGERVPSANPYWDDRGVTVADPDGYRLVLTSRSWD